MGLRRLDRLLVVVFLTLGSETPGKLGAQGLTLDKLGTTTTKSVTIKATLVKGKQYAATSPLVAVSINGVAYMPANCVVGTNGQVITIVVPAKQAAGNAVVQITVDIAGGGQAKASRTVTFQQSCSPPPCCCCPPPCCPPPPPPPCPPPPPPCCSPPEE